MQRALADDAAATTGLDAQPVTLIAAGKAADAMVRGFRASGLSVADGMIATTHVRDEGAAASPAGAAVAPAFAGVGALRVFLAGHPVPTAESQSAGLHALALARSASEAPASQAAADDAASGRRADPERPLVVLLSGGASALLVAPAEGLTLADKMRTTRALLGAGAAIHELNAVRKHLSAIKGGQLAAAARGRRVHTYALSDVISPVEDDPGVIGSGPTSADATTFADAVAVIDRLGVRDEVPEAALRVLQEGIAGRRPDTPKPGDARLARTRFTLIGSRRDAMTAARVEAERRGIWTMVIDEPVSGEAREAAGRLFATATMLARGTGIRPCCVIASGETTVRVTGSGRGGRNQEFALALVDALALAEPGNTTPRPIAAASVGTDGIDGPTDAAGAMVDSTTRARAERAGLAAPAAFLANNDAYHFFAPLGDLLRPGPTDTNVCDLQLFLFA